MTEKADLGELKKLHPCIGYSTGCFADIRGDWQSMFERAADFSTRAIELSELSQEEAASLANFLMDCDDVRMFDHVSVHAPAKNLCGSEYRRVALLKYISEMNVHSIIVHPDVVNDFELYGEFLGNKLVIENLDDRKTTGREPGDLKIPPSAGFCLDVAHVKTNDPTMELGHRFVDRFSDRIREVHISSIDDDGHHTALTASDLDLYMPLLDCCQHVPWILEG